MHREIAGQIARCYCFRRSSPPVHIGGAAAVPPVTRPKGCSDRPDRPPESERAARSHGSRGAPRRAEAPGRTAIRLLTGHRFRRALTHPRARGVGVWRGMIWHGAAAASERKRRSPSSHLRVLRRMDSRSHGEVRKCPPGCRAVDRAYVSRMYCHRTGTVPGAARRAGHRDWPGRESGGKVAGK